MRRSSERNEEERREMGASHSHFYKIIHSSCIQDRRLALPKKFIRSFGKELSRVAVLKVPHGKEWDVKLREDEGRVWFHNGWNEFMDYYCIGFCHLLVFRYEGESRFSVVICDMSASEIEYPCHTNDLKNYSNEYRSQKSSEQENQDEEMLELFTLKQATEESDDQKMCKNHTKDINQQRFSYPFVAPKRKGISAQSKSPISNTCLATQEQQRDKGTRQNKKSIRNTKKRVVQEEKGDVYFMIDENADDCITNSGYPSSDGHAMFTPARFTSSWLNNKSLHLKKNIHKKQQLHQSVNYMERQKLVVLNKETDNIKHQDKGVRLEAARKVSVDGEVQQRLVEEVELGRKPNPIFKRIKDKARASQWFGGSSSSAKDKQKAVNSEIENDIAKVEWNDRSVDGRKEARKLKQMSVCTRRIFERKQVEVAPKVSSCDDLFSSDFLSNEEEVEALVARLEAEKRINELRTGKLHVRDLKREMENNKQTTSSPSFSSISSNSDNLHQQKMVEDPLDSYPSILYRGVRSNHGSNTTKPKTILVHSNYTKQETRTREYPILQDKCQEELESAHSRPAPIQENQQSNLVARAFTSKNPFCTVILRPSYVRLNHYLTLPMTFAKKYLKENVQHITLSVSDGRTWQVKCSFLKHQYFRLFNGWMKFVSDNHLEENDVCIFELADKKNKELKVSIIKVNRGPKQIKGISTQSKNPSCNPICFVRNEDKQNEGNEKASVQNNNNEILIDASCSVGPSESNEYTNGALSNAAVDYSKKLDFLVERAQAEESKQRRNKELIVYTRKRFKRKQADALSQASSFMEITGSEFQSDDMEGDTREIEALAKKN